MPFDIIGRIDDIEVIASGHGVRDRHRLRARYGGRHWRKLKGIATVCVDDGRLFQAEVHGYEAQGVARVRMKIKRFID